jgi:hypothetical protein
MEGMHWEARDMSGSGLYIGGTKYVWRRGIYWDARAAQLADCMGVGDRDTHPGPGGLWLRHGQSASNPM